MSVTHKEVLISCNRQAEKDEDHFQGSVVTVADFDDACMLNQGSYVKPNLEPELEKSKALTHGIRILVGCLQRSGLPRYY